MMKVSDGPSKGAGGRRVPPKDCRKVTVMAGGSGGGGGVSLTVEKTNKQNLEFQILPVSEFWMKFPPFFIQIPTLGLEVADRASSKLN